MARRLPVYLLIDTSGSMNGEPIESVRVGLDTMLSTLCGDAYALETAWLSIITYDRDCKQILPLTPIADVQIPEIEVPMSGPTNMGAALEMLCDKVRQEVRKTTAEQKGDWMPLLFLMTDGKPTDVQLFNNMIPKVKACNFGTIVCLAAGPKAVTDDLKLLSDNVYKLDTLDGATMVSFFKWVSTTVMEGGKSGSVETNDLMPPPPSEINIVL